METLIASPLLNPARATTARRTTPVGRQAAAKAFAGMKRVCAIALAMAGCATLAQATGTVHERSSAAVSTSRAKPARVQTALTQNWQFIQDDSLSDEAALRSDGSGWNRVSLPHTWNAFDAANANATTSYKRGLGWYRLEFDARRADANRWLQFDGASLVAEVWLNGKKLGGHAGAFTAFRFDVSADLVDGKNVLLVKTDNSKPTRDTDPTWLAPVSGDFNLSGGLYRGVSMVSTASRAHFALDDMGSTGIYANTAAIQGGNATVEVRSKLRNDAGAAGRYTIHALLLDAQGHVVEGARKSLEMKAGEPVDVVQALLVKRAHLWQGIEDPYLYTLTVELEDRDGQTIDRVSQRFGIRQMSFDPDKGFFLNGKSLTMRGVNMHQDTLGKGWAVSRADLEQSLRMIKDMGANAVRMAHYPYSNDAYSLADELGLIVFAENGFVGGVAPSCSTASPSGHFKDSLRRQTQEMVRQNFNHASIAMWSIGNEVTQNQARCPKGTETDNVTALLRELQVWVKQEDGTRVTALADYGEHSYTPSKIAVGGITDVWGVNRYYQWYYGAAEEFGRNLDELHAKYPRQPIGVTEYGAGSALSDQTDNPLGGPPGTFNVGVPRLYQPEGYANHVHEQTYRQIASKNYLWGSFVWCMFDFGSDLRNEGDVFGVNTKGLVSYDRLTKKDAYFFYKANWGTEPVTYIAGRRYVQRAYRIADVTVYSNADTVRLSVNGAQVAALDHEQCEQGVCAFKGVALQAGTNVLVATGVHQGREVIDTVQWMLTKDNASNVYIAAGQVTTGFRSGAGQRYGSDNFFAGGKGMPVAPSGTRDPKDFTPVAGGDAVLYAAYRSGEFGYDIPLAPGHYNVTLGFIEPDKATRVGGRVFDVAANGSNQIVNLDVLATAGAYRQVVTKTFPVHLTGGSLRLDFKASVGEAMVSNITVTKQ
jgi:beta-galactosidase